MPVIAAVYYRVLVKLVTDWCRYQISRTDSWCLFAAYLVWENGRPFGHKNRSFLGWNCRDGSGAGRAAPGRLRI